MAEDESLNDLGLARVCRSCLADEGEMKSLFSGISDNPDVEVFRILECCTGLEISQGDGLPAVICLQCDLRLTNAYEFRKLSQKSEKIMRQYIGNVAKYSTKEEHPIETTYIVETLETDEDIKYESAEVADAAEEAVEEPDQIEIDDKSDDHKSDIDVEQNNVCDNENSLDSDDKPLLIRQEKSKLIQYDDEVIKDVIMSSKRKLGDKRECKLCGFVASNSRGLTVHISHLHKELKDKWCNVCYEEVDNLMEHLQTHNLVLTHTCALCERAFSCQSHLIEHIKGHSVNRPYKCSDCEKGFISLRHLKVHSRIHDKVKPYNCPHCKRGFTQKVSLKGHLRIHTGCKPYRCECNKKFTTSGALATHRKTTGHLEYVKIQVEEQEPMLNDVDEISIAEAIKKETNLSDSETAGVSSSLSTKARKLCTVCGKTFSNSSKLRLHMRVHTGETPYKCQYCPKQFTTRGQLVVHVRTHTGEKPHVCHVCGKGFAQSSVLNTHMRLHTGRPVECKVCQQRFCRPAELKLHMRKHTGEKPYLCTECGHSFIQRSHLMEHIKTHSDERPYKCHVCERAFKQSSSLKSHIQIHTGYKPFKCSQCPYACRQSYSLTQHMKQHNVDQPEANKPHLCLVCTKSFSTFAMLTSHSRTVHQAIF